MRDYLFLAYRTLDTYNSSNGMASIAQAAADAEPSTFPMILLGLFIITLLSTYFAQRKLTFGRVSFAASFAVAGYITVITAFIMTAIPGLISTFTLTTCIVVAIIGTAFLLFNRD